MRAIVIRVLVGFAGLDVGNLYSVCVGPGDKLCCQELGAASNPDLSTHFQN